MESFYTKIAHVCLNLDTDFGGKRGHRSTVINSLVDAVKKLLSDGEQQIDHSNKLALLDHRQLQPVIDDESKWELVSYKNAHF